MLCALGGNRDNKMASRSAPNSEGSKLRKTFKEVLNSTKPKLKEVFRTLTIDFEKSIGKKALVNVVCNALNISTSGPCWLVFAV